MSEDRPIFITRPVVDTGGIITGGLAQVGSVRRDRRHPLRDELRASRRSVPGLEEQLDRRQLRHRLRTDRVEPGDPFRDCSSGIVTSDSTSAADSPRQDVWISTRGGANSGKTSTGMASSWPTPKNIIAPANATTR